MDEHQRLVLETNLARDRAENLLAGLRRAFDETRAEIAAGKRPDLTPEQIAAGEMAMQNAMASAERMLANLNAALAVAEAGFEEDDEHESLDDPVDGEA